MSKLKLSANLGFLWKELSLPDAIRAAKQNGFNAVECHWPFDTPAQFVSAALNETGLNMLSLNTAPGDMVLGEFGLCSLPNKVVQARKAIDQALFYASQIDAPFIHVMAGNARGRNAHETFIENLNYASIKAKLLGITLLIEPLNQLDAPAYFLNSTKQASDIITELNVDNIKLLFDFYHIEILEGNAVQRFNEFEPLIGHIQVASVPDRQSPDKGALNYEAVFNAIKATGFVGYVGAEYKPIGNTEASLAWMSTLT